MVILGFLGYPGHGVKTTVAALSAIGVGVSTPYSHLACGWGSAPKRHLYNWRQGVRLPYRQWPSTMSIYPNPSWVEIETETSHWGVVCLPGYPWMVKTRTAHFGALDGIVLTVLPADLDAEIESELRKQMLVAHHMGARSIVIFLNNHNQNCGGDEAEAAEQILRTMLLQCGYTENEMAFVRGSAGATFGPKALQASTAEALRKAIEDTISPRNLRGGPFKLCVTKSYRIAGLGQVLAGRVTRGRVDLGDTLCVIRQRGVAQTAIAEDLEVFRSKRESASAGELVGILVKTSNCVERRGTVIAEPGSISLVQEFVGEVHWGPEETHSRSAFPGHLEAQVFIGSAVAGVRVRVAGERPAPGTRSLASFQVQGAIVAEVGSRFSLHWQHKIVGLGIVAKITPLLIDM